MKTRNTIMAKRGRQGASRKPALFTLTSALGLAALGIGCSADDSKRSGSVPVTAVEMVPAPVPPPPAVVVAQSETSPVPPAEPLPAPTAIPILSPSAEEVVQLARAQVGQEVVLAYIQGVEAPFNLNADAIVYLTDLGVESETVTAMVNRDQVLRGQLALETMDTQETAPPPATLAEATVTEPLPQSATAPAPPPPEGTPVTTVSAPATQVTNNYFYNTLSPYGTWVDVPDFGWCWQPTVAVTQADWRPYCHGGRWIWTDCGWYWQSYYSWGWAPFHYGRWHLSSGRGWVWVPGTHWGPAWVTWRSYDGYCGWAPLPPAAHYVSGVGFTYYGRGVSMSFGFGLSSACYSFVPVHHFYTPRPWNHCAPRSTVNKFYGNTTIINNYVVGNNNTVINNGIGTETVARASRTEIRKVRVADSYRDHATPSVRAERLSRDGSTLMAYRPQLPEQAKRPPAALTDRQERAAIRSASVVDSPAVAAARVRADASSRSEANRFTRASESTSTTSSRQPSQAPARTENRSGASYSTTERNVPTRSADRQPANRLERSESPRTPTPAAPNRTLSSPTGRSSETVSSPQRMEAPASRSPNVPTTRTPSGTLSGRTQASPSPNSRFEPRRSSPTVAIPTPTTPQNSRSAVLPTPSNRSPVLDAGRNRPEPVTRTPAYTPTPLTPSSRSSVTSPSSIPQRNYTPRSAPAPRSTFTPGPSTGTRTAPTPSYRSTPSPAPSRSTPAPSYRAPAPAPTPRAAPTPRSAPPSSSGSRGSRTSPQ